MNLSDPSRDLVENIVSRYRDFLYSRDYSTPTVKNYLSDLRHLVSWAESKFQGFSFDKITYRNISEYRSDIKEIFKGKPAIAARRLSSLKIFVGWAVSQNLLPEELLKTLESGKRDKDDLAVVGRFRTYLLSTGYSKPTIKNYLSDLRHLIDWIAKNYEQFKFATLTEESVRNYRSHLKDKFRTKPSISARRLSSLRKFLSWAGKNGLVTEDLLRSLQKALALPAEKPTTTTPPAPIQIVPPTPLPTPAPPVDISQYKPHQKAIHHIRNTRPGWYHAYHQRDWASTLHTVITILFAVAVGSLFLYTEVIRPQLEQTQEQFAQELGDVLAAATPPRILSFQGRLTDDSDVPVSSSTDIVFKIYSVRTGGSALWTSKTWTLTPNQNGIFSVCLGGQDTSDDCLIDGVADTAIPSTLFAENDSLYLGVTVESDSEMTPRQRIASVSYALNSDALEGFHGSQSPGANQVPILDGSANLVFAAAATIDTSSGALTLGSAGTGTISLPASGDDVALTGDLDVSGLIFQDGSSGTNLFNADTSFTLPATGNISIDAAATDNTQAGGVIDLEVDSVGDNGTMGLYIDYELVDDADATDVTNAIEINLLKSSADRADEIHGLKIVLKDTDSGGYGIGGTGASDSLLYLASELDAVGTEKFVHSAIYIDGGPAGYNSIATAIDASDAEIMYALNAGGNPIIVADGFSMDLSLVNMSDTSEGIHLGQSTSCSSATTEGQICWDTDNDSLYIGTGFAAKEIGGGGSGPTVVRKTADESLASSTTLQDDDHLTWSVGTSETWAVTFNLEVYNHTTPDIKFAVTAPSGSTCNYVIGVPTSYGDFGSSDTCGGSMALTANYTGDQQMTITGIFTTGGSSGSITLQWAQNTSSATAIYVRKGSHLVAHNITGADLAEVYHTNDLSITPGTLVSIDPELRSGVKKTQGAYDRNVLGVVSTQPGQILGGSAGSGHPVFLGLVGQVPTRVSTENGSIRPGDLLTTSSIPGVAMKATHAGYVIGRALTSYDSEDPDEIGTVLVFINTHYANPAKLDSYGELQDLEPDKTATSSALLTLDSENNLVATISAGTKFVWINSIGEVISWVSDTGEAFFNKVAALVGDFGKLVFGELVTKEGSQAAGEAEIIEGGSEIFIESAKVTEDSLIYITSTTRTNGLNLFIKEKKPEEGFVVGIERTSEPLPHEATPSASEAIKFNWLIINRE